MSDVKAKVRSRYEANQTPRAEDVEQYEEGVRVEVAVAGKLFVGTVERMSPFGTYPQRPASLVIRIDEQATEIPSDDSYHGNLPSKTLTLKSGTLRGEDTPEDKLSASLKTPDAARSCTLLGVVGSLRRP